MKYILKRDGIKEPFNPEKIKNAILKAFAAVDGQLTDYAIEKANNVADYIEGYCVDYDGILSIEEIQDLVEHGLMSTKRKDVAKAYITYRQERTKVREANGTYVKNIENKLNVENNTMQNANVDEESFGGRVGEASSANLKEYALNYCMPKWMADLHRNNQIYIHDLDHYALGDHNCLSVPFDKLLANGFNTRQTDVRPANSVNTAFQLVAVIFQLQSLNQFGGVSATHLDWTMVPYVRKSFYKHYHTAMIYLAEDNDGNGLYLPEKYQLNNFKKFILSMPSIEDDYFKQYKHFYKYAMDMTERETYQAVEGMYHNLNTLQSRSGNQLPFTSINYGTCTLPEGWMIIKALLDVSIEGIGALHKTSIFPCGIFQCMKGVNRAPGDPNYDLFKLALKSTAQRLYPNYANVDWTGNKGYDRNDPKTYFSTMGCRTANGFDINGMGQTKDGRGNICPVTIILPTIAMETKLAYINKYGLEVAIEDNSHIIDVFISELDKKIYQAKDMLIERFNYICSQSPASAKFMWENGTMEGYIPEEGIRSALRHGTLAMGQLGLAECLQILIGKDHTTPEGMDLAKHIEQLFKNRCAEFKQEYKLNFGVYFTPAQNLCYTAMTRFKEKYGEIPNISENKFFTNSMHVPVWKEISPFDKIDIEAELTPYSSAGCITYVELDSGVKNNLDALETLVNYAMDKDIPYFAINVPNDMCMDCGYTDEINDKCPQCGSQNIQRLRRVTGYLTGNYTTAFNLGKQQEVEKRFKHSKLLRGWKE